MLALFLISVKPRGQRKDPSGAEGSRKTGIYGIVGHVKPPYCSVIIPVYNEEGNLESLVSTIRETMRKLGRPWEVLLVNDGSTDGSETVLRRLQKKYSEITIINFTRNFGQTAAFSAGFDGAKGQILITMDADLQNDPRDITDMLGAMKREHADIVCGWRKKRNDPILRTLLSVCANRMIAKVLGSHIHDLGCSLRVYKRHVVRDIELFGEMHRFIPVLAGVTGARVVEIPVLHHPRRWGRSKYGLTRTLKVFLDVITLKYLTAYQTKPIYLFGSVGLMLILMSVLAASWVIIRRIFLHGDWVSPMLFIMTVLFNSGVLCILMGLLAEIQMRAWYSGSKKKSYSIRS
ncbi:glycosyltransferase family 2 protein [Candidatus Gottesmanbacteria bacterium]|nr:glycosyltransferase family 2 protein [Candidatus Gottesmanbacteria bacterium]